MDSENASTSEVPAPIKKDLWSDLGFAIFILVATLVIYIPALPGKIVWDDEWWTTSISHLVKDFSGLRTIWTQPTALQQYFPVTGTSFWIDHRLWGDWLLPEHLENVLLHVASALLLWRLLRNLGVPGAKFAAVIFALHPVMVESVAWITERKNALSMPLFLAALLFYGKFMGFWAATESPRRWGAYGWAFLLFALALLAKISVFALPAVVLLIAWWKAGRLRWKQDILPTLPFFVMSISFGIYIAWLEKHNVGAEGRDWDLTLAERFLVAGRALWFYMGKLLWPSGFCPIYPRWQLDVHSPVQWLWPAGALLALLAAWLLRKRLGRGLLAALLFYAGTLFPVSGFMNAYGMVYSFVSFRWVYIPSLGLIVLAGAVVARIMARRPRLWWGFSSVIFVLLGVVSWNAAHVYIDPKHFWAATFSGNPDCWVAWYDQGLDLTNEGKWDEAIASYNRALELRPGYAQAENNLGQTLMDAGRPAEALVPLEKCLEIWPEQYAPHYNLGQCFLLLGKLEDAAAQFRRTVELQPGSGNAHNNLGIVLFRLGKIQESAAEYRKVIELKPNDADAHCNLAEVLRQLSFMRDAADEYEATLRLDPDNKTALKSLATLRSVSGDSSLRNGEEAIRLAERADKLFGGKDASLVRILAAAYAEAGQFPQAVETARRARDMVSPQSETYDLIEKEIRHYDLGLPIRD